MKHSPRHETEAVDSCLYIGYFVTLTVSQRPYSLQL
jgi:hypothetical protein